jgi:hypothetical protein
MSGAVRNIMRGLKKLPGRNPGLKSNLTEDPAGYYYSLGAVFTIKTLPATSRITPLFPHPSDFRGHNSGKRGTGLELLSDFRRERMRSNIAMLQKPKQG